MIVLRPGLVAARIAARGPRGYVLCGVRPCARRLGYLALARGVARKGSLLSTLTEVAEVELGEPEVTASGRSLDRVVRAAPYAAVWVVLLVPTLRTMARGWRPVGDNGTIALQAWNTFSLHIPLVGQGTGAANGLGGAQTVGNPGPLEYWLLAPFVHIDPGQGALLGSALLCGAALTLGVYVLQKTAGLWAAVVLAVVVADLAIVSPFAFIDPVWNSDFASFWFLSFLAVAFAVGSGNLRYLPLLVFVASVTIDSHLLFAPSTGLALIAVVVCGLLLQRPDNYRWLWWTVGVTAVCWIAPLGQQLFGSHPNLTALLKSFGVGSGQPVKTFGSLLGLRALARAASPKAVWATPRPIQPGASYRDVLQSGHLVYCIVFFALLAIFVLAWRHKKTYLISLSAVTIASAIGLVLLYARVPRNYTLSFEWISQAVWIVGICIWLTGGYAVVIWARNRLSVRRGIWVPNTTLKTSMIVLTALAVIAGTLVVMFPYNGRGQRLDYAAWRRVQNEAKIIETYVPRSDVGINVRYSGRDFIQRFQDEHGTAYLLETAGWIPGLPPQSNGLLHDPIEPGDPSFVFDENQRMLTGFERYPDYSAIEILLPQHCNRIAPRLKSEATTPGRTGDAGSTRLVTITVDSLAEFECLTRNPGLAALPASVKNPKVQTELSETLTANSAGDSVNAVSIKNLKTYYLVVELRNFNLSKLKFLHKLKQLKK